MSIVEFPTNNPKVLDEWIWQKDLGKPYGDINGAPCDVEPPIEKRDTTPISPNHYTHYGVECIELTEHMPFLEGNIVKYVYRHKEKDGKQDVLKARWYIDRLLMSGYGVDADLELRSRIAELEAENKQLRAKYGI